MILCVKKFDLYFRQQGSSLYSPEIRMLLVHQYGRDDQSCSQEFWRTSKVLTLWSSQWSHDSQLLIGFFFFHLFLLVGG